ncbi:COX15/CtaA family protein [Ideonella livida]|uniref:COX15/CtaA family protein n=1 Tax=Ideonella livida TaxID=2707176 RepID=UPI002873A47D|nr:COX15/CtaA family protein [Ideonella livida]
MNVDALIRLALVGGLLAAVPLTWWLLSQRGQPPARRLAALTALTLFLTLDLLAFGVFTRLSDSGLGCPDWPGCYGLASPVGAQAHIAQAEAAQPDGPVTWAKAWIEMVHRYLAMAVGLLILIGAVAAWRHRRALPHSPGWAALTLVWVVVQGLFGKYTVTLKLYPAIVTLHLLGALVLLGLLALQHMSYRQALAPPPAMHPQTWRRLAGVGLGLLTVQVALGGWVSTNYAVLACQGFPACNGSFWPSMAWSQGFSPLRPLGHAQDGGLLAFEALVAIHWTHRLFAMLVLGCLGVLAWRLWRQPVERRWGQALAGLLALQLVTGVSNVVLSWPLAAALVHSVGAALLFTLLVALLAGEAWARHAPAPGAPQPGGRRRSMAVMSSSPMRASALTAGPRSGPRKA